jgi:hypothetical protein
LTPNTSVKICRPQALEACNVTSAACTGRFLGRINKLYIFGRINKLYIFAADNSKAGQQKQPAQARQQ